jgi:hypothetical protein
MGVLLALLGVITIIIPIPFWHKAIALNAVLGLNIGTIVVTIAISVYYDSYLPWAQAAPVRSGTVVAALLLSRATLAWSVAVIAGAVQAATFVVLNPGNGATALGFLADAAATAAWSLMVLLPWALLARFAVGRLAGAWGVIALALAASLLSSDVSGRAVEIAAWIVPWIPAGGRAPETLGLPGSWLYALAHAGAVAAVATALFRRGR